MLKIFDDENKLPYYAAIFCIIVSCWNIYTDLFYKINGEGNYVLRYFFGLVNLGIIFTRGFLGYNGVNYANAIFDVLLILGSILYLVTNGRETRLFRAGWGVVLLSNSIAVIYKIFWICFYHAQMVLSVKNILSDIASTAYTIALVYFGYRLVRYFNQQKTLAEDVYQNGDATLVYSVEATRGQRITHALLDGLLALLLFSPVTDTLIYALNQQHPYWFNGIENGRVFIIFLFAVWRLLYYLFFESLFATTPAKMMTETRVTDANGYEPGVVRVLGRTAGRFVPFEGLSVLFNAGWHDRWSNTSVVQEKRTGVPGANYYWLPPAIIGVFFLCTVIAKNVEEFKTQRDYQAGIENYKNDLQAKIRSLNKNDFLTMERINNGTQGDYQNETSNVKGGKFLLVEDVRRDSVVCAVIKAYKDAYSQPGQMEAEHAYQTGRDTLRHMVLAKRDLLNALLSEGESYVSEPEPSVKGVKINGTLHAVKSVGRFFQPNIKLSDRSGWGEAGMGIGLENTGWPSQVVKIDVLEGDVQFTTPLPVRLNASIYSNGGGIMLDADVKGDNKEFKVNVTVQDTTGRNYVYQVAGNSADRSPRTIKQIK